MNIFNLPMSYIIIVIMQVTPCKLIIASMQVTHYCHHTKYISMSIMQVTQLMLSCNLQEARNNSPSHFVYNFLSSSSRLDIGFQDAE